MCKECDTRKNDVARALSIADYIIDYYDNHPWDSFDHDRAYELGELVKKLLPG